MKVTGRSQCIIVCFPKGEADYFNMLPKWRHQSSALYVEKIRKEKKNRYYKCSIETKLRKEYTTVKEVLAELGVNFTPESKPFICIHYRDRLTILSSSRKRCSESLSLLKKVYNQTRMSERSCCEMIHRHHPQENEKKKRLVVSTQVRR